MRQIAICETLEDVADAAADLICEAQREAIAERGVFRIAFSGGVEIGELLEELATEDWSEETDWERWEVFWSDERAVPPAHPDSHYRMAYEALLDYVPIGEVWRMPGETENLSEAADEYARTIKSRFGPGAPVFDVIVLSIGQDGHVAALFPGDAAIESGALIEVVESKSGTRMLTFTPRVINQARRVILLAAGEDKAQSLRQLLVEEDFRLPAARIQLQDGECWWVLDQAAASLIR
ncbi:6-phosphogluconolactonase [bacterium]|nr:6-phosphogluconolactonase [bacterium]MBU1984669.1 6-phosphogluconolactonase [bacterium]